MDSMVLTDGDKSWETWMAALSGALAVALVGALPILFLPNEHNQKEKPFLEFFLSISVGSQLSDVFLHLLPEAFASSSSSSSSLSIGLWTLTGFLLFFLLEQIFLDDSSSSTTTTIKMTGYLNLLANFLDNFSHGAAIGGSFSISPFLGSTTLMSILIHEIPHELGDFAILLQAGFDRCQATKAQIITGSGALLGAFLALLYSKTFQSTLWVLPFTSGAFLYVSLVKTLPELIKQNDLRHSIRQICGLFLGFALIYCLVQE